MSGSVKSEGEESFPSDNGFVVEGERGINIQDTMQNSIRKVLSREKGKEIAR